MVDLLNYLRGDIASGQLAGRPVGVTQQPGGNAIYQVQLDALNSRRFLQVKGSFGAPCQWEELFYDDQFIYRAIDLSSGDGQPYTLRDPGAARGSKWAKRQMNEGDKFERNAFVIKFDPATGADRLIQGPVRSWLKFAKRHAAWHGVSDVVELHWCLDEACTVIAERYFYRYGLIGFEGDGQSAYPNFVWDRVPPAAGVPVLARKEVGFSLPPLPVAADPNAFWLLDACDFPHVRTSGYGQRPTPETGDSATEFHDGVDDAPTSAAQKPYHVRAPRDGRVTFAGWDGTGYGNCIKLDVGGGYEVLLGHLESIAVATGQHVTVGQRIGVAGSSGRSTATHLHTRLHKDGQAIDPTPFIRATVPTPHPIPEPPVEPDDTQPTQPLPTTFTVTLPLPADPTARAFIIAALRATADSMEKA